MENSSVGIESDISSLISALETATLKELRAIWEARWGAPPRLRSLPLLRHLIAWRIQTATFGDLDPHTRQQIASQALPKATRLATGTCLTREYRGVLHEVRVAPDSYLYDGRSFRSLSAVASAITGTHWNGPHFFGLRPSGAPL